MQKHPYHQVDLDDEKIFRQVPVFISFQAKQQRNSDKESLVIEWWHYNHPPLNFVKYLLYFLPKKDCEALLGDLEEEYCEIYRKSGKGKATFWYCYQVAMSFWPIIIRAVKKLGSWGVIGWFGNWIRRFVQ